MAERMDTCGYCRFYKPFQDGQGACRRKAPVLIDVSEVDPARPELGRIYNYQAAWPMMASDEWCGDFEPVRA